MLSQDNIVLGAEDDGRDDQRAAPSEPEQHVSLGSPPAEGWQLPLGGSTCCSTSKPLTTGAHSYAGSRGSCSSGLGSPQDLLCSPVVPQRLQAQGLEHKVDLQPSNSGGAAGESASSSPGSDPALWLQQVAPQAGVKEAAHKR